MKYPKSKENLSYADLKPYRERLWEYLDNLNVTILGMEKFGAGKSSPLETCLEEVSKSDIFTGITGLTDEEIFPIHEHVLTGKIIKLKDDDGKTRYEFQYMDKYGYKKTMGGLSHMLDNFACQYARLITKLLKKNIEIKEIADIFDGFNTKE